MGVRKVKYTLNVDIPCMPDMHASTQNHCLRLDIAGTCTGKHDLELQPTRVKFEIFENKKINGAAFRQAFWLIESDASVCGAGRASYSF